MTTPIKQGFEFGINAITAYNQFSPDITALGDGRWLTVWNDPETVSQQGTRYGIRAQIMNADGTASGTSSMLIAPNGPYPNDFALFPSVAGLQSGGFAASWIERSEANGPSGIYLYGRQYTSANPPVAGTSETLTIPPVNLSADAPDVVQLVGGNLVYVWSELYLGPGSDFLNSIFVTVTASDGTDIITHIKVETAAGNQEQPAVTALSTGGFVVAWRDDNGDGDGSGSTVQFQRYDASGLAQGGNTVVPAQTTGNQTAPAIAGLADGRFVVVFADASQQYVGDTSGTAVVARVFNADGSALQDFRVNTLSAGNQSAPAITTLTDGRFFVAWVDGSGNEGVGGTGTAIRGQLFAFNGTTYVPDGSEFLVNTYTFGDQLAPTVTTLADGRIVVAWQTASGVLDNDGTGISSQILDPRESGQTWLATGAGPSQYYGTIYNDILYGGSGSNTISGGAGDDVLGGGASDDVLNGGDGSDTLIGYGGVNTLSGGDGNDVLWFHQGDSFNGGAGFDYLISFYSADDTLDIAVGAAQVEGIVGSNGNGVTGNDRIDGTGATTALYIWGLGGNDTLIQGDNGGYLFGGDGDDTLTGGTGADSLLGNAGADHLFGGDGNDVLFIDSFDTYDGGDGGDYAIVDDPATGDFTWNLAGHNVEAFIGNAGNDTVNAAGINASMQLYGGTGDDVITGANGSSVLQGQDGDDRLTGGSANDVLVGGVGSDQLRGGVGDDQLYIDSQDTVYDGGAGYDVLFAIDSSGVNTAIGSSSIEHVVIVDAIGANSVIDARGAIGAVQINGLYGSATMYGGAGNDTLLAGDSGDYTFNGGLGNDVIFGTRNGQNQFVFEPGAGHDFIDHYVLGTHNFDLRAYAANGLNSFAALTITELQNYFVVDFAGDGFTAWRSSAADHLSSADFIFG